MCAGMADFNHLNFGKNSTITLPTSTFAQFMYVFHSLTFKEKWWRGKVAMLPFGWTLGRCEKFVLFSIRLDAKKWRSSFCTPFLMWLFKTFISQLSPVPRKTEPDFTFCTTLSAKCPPRSFKRVSRLPWERQTPSLFSRS